MRAMTASGIVPSTMAGRIRWRTASHSAPLFSSGSARSASQASISMKPVCGCTSNIRSSRPDTGVQPSPTEKIRISSKPHQKMGME
ncbi:hypothetical protein D9M69_654710 [compost metagenome]